MLARFAKPPQVNSASIRLPLGTVMVDVGMSTLASLLKFAFHLQVPL